MGQDYTQKNKDELKQMAQQRNVHVNSDATKDEIIQALEANDQAGQGQQRR